MPARRPVTLHVYRSFSYPYTKISFQLKVQCNSQCSGSGSRSTGSTCFRAFWIRIHLSEIWIRIRLRIRILLSSSKNSKKNLDSYRTVLWLLLDFVSLKNDVNVPSKSNKQKNLFFKISFLLVSWRSMMKIAGSGSESGSDPFSQRHGSADPDPDPH